MSDPIQADERDAKDDFAVTEAAFRKRVLTTLDTMVRVTLTLTNTVEILTKKVDELQESMMVEDGPSPTTLLLQQVVAGLDTLTDTMTELPVKLGQVIREEMAMLEPEPEMVDADAARFEEPKSLTVVP